VRSIIGRCNLLHDFYLSELIQKFVDISIGAGIKLLTNAAGINLAPVALKSVAFL